MFQFTHPGKGATELDDDEVLVDGFNSRTLGRVRPLIFITISLELTFQFTHPGKGATLTKALMGGW